jgi:4-alpha-glucanotransferase
VEIHWEKGGIKTYSLAIASLKAGEAKNMPGAGVNVVQAPLPDEMPIGYHELSVSCGTVTSSTRLIVCPEKAYLPQNLAGGGRAAGVAVSLYGLRSKRNWGCGDFGDLKRMVDWVAEDLGGAFIGLNPLHAIHNRQPFNTSPYLPNSVFYGNPIYIDIERLEDFVMSPEARAAFSSPEMQTVLESLRSAEYVEYESVYALKLRFLRLCFDAFMRVSRGGPQYAEFRKYAAREGELLDRFATYCALDEWLHKSNEGLWTWRDWPAEYQNPSSEATRRFAADHPEEILFHKYVQWQFDRQLGEAQDYAVRKGLPIGLYHDLALATDRCGSDLWGHRDFFVNGCRVGAPPDGFAPKGQDWGFPPPNAERHFEDGYRHFSESIRHNCRHGGALRIDHVMRFFRLFWIPDGMEAADGTYVSEPAEDLLRILALESVRNKVMIVGEDLGTVEPESRAALERFGVLSYRLLYFERSPAGEFRQPEEYPRQALVSSTTHDLPTLAGFWLNRDIEARKAAGLLGGEAVYQAQLAARAADKQRMLDALHEAGLLPKWFPRDAPSISGLTPELHNAVIGFLSGSSSMLMLLNQEDLTLETDQQNLPGSTHQYPNWRRKMKYSLEELRYLGPAQEVAGMFRHWLGSTGRLASGGPDPAAADVPLNV